MTYDAYPHSDSSLQVGRPPWLLFLFLTAVFFAVYHDFSYAKQGIGNYNNSADIYIAGVDEGSRTREIALLSLGFFAIVVLARSRTHVCLRSTRLVGWMVLSFVAWAFLSFFWAEDMALTFKRLMVFAILCIASAAVARRLSLREIILWILLSTSLFLLTSIFAEIVFGSFQPFASGYRLGGTLHPNGQGIDCGLLVLSAVAAADLEILRRTFFRICALVGFLLLILTQSRTALAALALALAAYYAAVCSKRTKITAAFVLSIVFGISLIASGGALFSSFKSAITLQRDDAGIGSFNGRLGLWKDLGYFIERRPVVGYGYGGFWTPTHINVISAEEKWPVPEGHSAYLDCLLTLGFVGLVVYAFLLFAGIARTFRFQRVSRSPALAFCGAVLVFSALIGFLESGVTSPSLTMFLCMVILVQIGFVYRPVKTGVRLYETRPLGSTRVSRLQKNSKHPGAGS
jgi:exopolysaccharide production protein ExoQ